MKHNDLKVILSILLALATCTLFAQNNPLNQKINLTLQEADFQVVLQQIEQQTDFEFAFADAILPDESYTIDRKNITVKQGLNVLLKNTKLKYKVVGQQILIIRKKYYELYGIIKDKSTNEALTAATIYIKNNKTGRSTNEYGYYSFNLLEGSYTLVISYLGMQSSEKTIVLSKKTRLNVSLAPYELEFKEVIVNPTQNGELTENAPLDQKSMMALSGLTPGIGGEPDLLHIIRAKAGVQSSAGGIGGFYVRGGNTGHNLVLLDGVPVYNWMHLLGMNSIFHPEAVRGVQFHTAGFSAKYGGRIASVIDIQSKEGNPEKWTGMAGVNERSYHGHISGPLGNDKGAFWIGGRELHQAPYVRDIIQDAFPNSNLKGINPYYYDFNAKINQQFGLNDRIYLSYYNGLDNISASTSADEEELEIGDEVIENDLNYGNRIASLRWNHIYGKNLFSNLTVNYSDFSNQFYELASTVVEAEEESDFVYSDVRSNNTEWSVKLDVDWTVKDHHIKAGGAFHQYNFLPFYGVYDQDSDFFPEDEELVLDSLAGEIALGLGLDATHTALYVEDEMSLSEKTKLRLGVRYTTFSVVDNDLIDESSYFQHLEPRLLLTTKLTDDSWLAFSTTKMVQYIHLISNVDIGLPQDLWLPSINEFEPTTAWQIGMDYHKNIADKWRLKGAIYYKLMDNLIVQPDTISKVNFGEDVTDQLLTGTGESYGGEFSALYKSGKWTGFGSYALSWANRNYEQLNTGEAFAFQFDARHYLQLLFHYQITPQLQVGIRGHFSSPRPQLVSFFGTLGGGIELYDINEEGTRNGKRGKLEHRLDVNMNYNFKTKNIHHQLRLGLYNVYNRQNPIFYYQDEQEQPTIPGLFVPFMISGYYSLRF